MSRIVIIVAGVMVALGLTLAGCGGGGARSTTTTKTTNTTTTMGQELQDLDQAYQDGLITESQYEKAKEDVLKRYDQ